MPSLTDTQTLPRLQDLGGTPGACGLRGGERAASRPDLVPALRDFPPVEGRPKVPGARRREERLHLLLSSNEPGMRDLPQVPIGLPDDQRPHLPQRDQLDMLVQQPAGDRSGLRAPAARVPDGAGVHDRPARVAAAGARHDVPAASAPDQASEQRTLLQAAGRPRLRLLRGTEDARIDDRRVSVGVDVRPDLQLAEVHPVGQQVPDPAGRHLQPVSDLHERHASTPVSERRPHHGGLRLIDDQAPRLPVTDIAQGRLASLPDPSGRGPLPERLELLGVSLTLGDVDGLLDVAHHPAGDRPSVELLPDADHSATCRLYALPQLVPAPAGQPRQVGADHARVHTCLDPFDGSAKARPVVDRRPTAHVQLDWEHDDRDAETFGFAADHALLIAGGMEAVGRRVTASEAADTHDTGEREYMVHDSHNALATWDRLRALLAPVRA